MSMIGNYLRVPNTKLLALREDPSGVVDVLYPEADEHPAGASLDIDKAWQAIHFLLTGDPWEGTPPLTNAVLGGAEVGDEDLGYGPARGLTAEEVRAVSEAPAGFPATSSGRVPNSTPSPRRTSTRRA